MEEQPKVQPTKEEFVRAMKKANVSEGLKVVFTPPDMQPIPANTKRGIITYCSIEHEQLVILSEGVEIPYGLYDNWGIDRNKDEE